MDLKPSATVAYYLAARQIALPHIPLGGTALHNMTSAICSSGASTDTRILGFLADLARACMQGLVAAAL